MPPDLSCRKIQLSPGRWGTQAGVWRKSVSHIRRTGVQHHAYLAAFLFHKEEASKEVDSRPEGNEPKLSKTLEELDPNLSGMSQRWIHVGSQGRSIQLVKLFL